MALKRYATATAFVLTLFLTFSLVSVSAQAAGGAKGGAAAASKSPFPENDPAAIKAGQALFTGKLGCYGCHGTSGGGGMGPALNDATWIYGGDIDTIYETVSNGRPNGMPKFAGVATEEEIWQVATFVRSLSAK